MPAGREGSRPRRRDQEEMESLRSLEGPAQRRRCMEEGGVLLEEVVLCAASAYTKKFYLNQAFRQLPPHIKDELKIMCVLFTEDIGGTLTLFFDEDGSLQFQTDADEGDLLYDEIGSVLKVKQLQRTRQDLLEALELYYKVLGG